MTTVVDSLRGEFLRYKALADAAIAQLEDDEVSASLAEGSNSVAVICRHLAGNLKSRFTDFLTTDGEKSWRDREAEFRAQETARAELLREWEGGWQVLASALAPLSDEQLLAEVTIRRQPMLVIEALHRSLAHTSYHVGQIVYIAKALRGGAWRYLSIPPGGSAAYNQSAQFERAEAQAAALNRGIKGPE